MKTPPNNEINYAGLNVQLGSNLGHQTGAPTIADAKKRITNEMGMGATRITWTINGSAHPQKVEAELQQHYDQMPHE